MIIIDGSKMTTKQAAHAEIAAKLGFPEHYGANLDALWDCLSETQATVKLENPGRMLENLGSYGVKLIQTLTEASAKLPSFTLILE